MRMRGMHRANRKVSYTQARQILEKAEYGVLSTICDDGCRTASRSPSYFRAMRFIFTVRHRGRNWTISSTIPAYASRRSPRRRRCPTCFRYAMKARWRSAPLTSCTARMNGLRRCSGCAGNTPPRKRRSNWRPYMNKLIVHTTVVRLDVEYISGKSSAQ